MMALEARPRLLLLGTGHWANHGRDVVNPVFDDMRSSRRQAEIAEVVTRLSAFAPTMIALEYPADAADELNDAYSRYRSGAFELTADEQHQLGFRLAEVCGHSSIFGIDWNEGTVSLGEAFAFAALHQPEIAAELDRLKNSSAGNGSNERIERTSVRELLRQTNSVESLREFHRPYLTIARIGEGKHYAGVEWVKGWYERNLIIFVNLTRLVTSPDDRILVIYGAGHIPLLTQFARESEMFSVESVDHYLG